MSQILNSSDGDLCKELKSRKLSVDLTTTIQGIPCGIHVDSYVNVAPFMGSPWECYSDLDYYGYIEIEYTILDRKGYPAKWLEAKLTPDDDERIQREIIQYKENQFEVPDE